MTRFRELLRQNRTWLRFGCVGAFGFAVDASVLFILFQRLQLDLEIARPLAFVCAATSNWLLNRIYTFGDMDLDGKKSLEWFRFVLSATLSAIPNLTLFFLLMAMLPETPGGIAVAMLAGILAGYYCNYRLARLWVYRSSIT